MISITELAQHFWAAAVLAAAVCVPGYGLAICFPAPLRNRDGWAAWPALGVAYWAAALYLLPVPGGLWLAMAAAVPLATLRASTAVRVLRTTRNVQPPRSAACRARRTACSILALGCAAYATPLLTQHVPPGMDASRYTYSARLIAARAGLPGTLAPFAPAVPFGAANHGLPATAAVAIACGASPASAVLAGIPLSLTTLVLSLYVLVRLIARRTAAAVIAVATAWLARDAQNTLTWGGFPCVLALAIGIVAARVLIDVLRHPNGRAMVPLGLLAGGLPLVHACTAVGWLYIGAPVAAVVGWCVSRARGRGLRVAALGAAVALGIVLMYVLVARPGLDEQAAQWVRTNELHGRLGDPGAPQLLNACRYLATASGRMLTGLFIAGLAVLATRIRVAALATILALLSLNLLVLVNASFESLPGSLLLYPTRLRLFPVAIAALTIALAWRVIARRVRASHRTATAASGVLLIVALTYNLRYFQRTAVRPAVGDGAWQALLWAQAHLDPRETFVANIYGDAAAYLPGVAGIAVSHFHANIADQSPAAEEQSRSRRVTHVFLTKPVPAAKSLDPARASSLQASVKQSGSELLFTNEAVDIYRLPPE
jgi:hypothetical protein